MASEEAWQRFCPFKGFMTQIILIILLHLSHGIVPHFEFVEPAI